MDTIRAFFPKSGHFFQFPKKARRDLPPLPSASYARENSRIYKRIFKTNTCKNNKNEDRKNPINLYNSYAYYLFYEAVCSLMTLFPPGIISFDDKSYTHGKYLERLNVLSVALEYLEGKFLSSECNGTPTHSHLFCKHTLTH